MIGKTKIGFSDKVSEGVQGRFVLTMIQRPLVGRKEGQDSSGIRAGLYVEPVNRFLDILVGNL